MNLGKLDNQVWHLETDQVKAMDDTRFLSRGGATMRGMKADDVALQIRL